MNHTSAPIPKLKVTQPPLLAATFIGPQIKPLHLIAFNMNIRNRGHILQQEPFRLSFFDQANEFAQQFQPFARRRNAAPGYAEILTGRTGDDSIELPCWRVEAPHIAPPQQIGAAHDAEAFRFKAPAKQVYSWKQRQNQHTQIVSSKV